MGVKIELEKDECNTIANALNCYLKYNADILKKDKTPAGKKLTKSLRSSIAGVRERAGDLHRFFLIVGK
jgi:hypothetical protein